MVKNNPKHTGLPINRIKEVLREQGRTQIWLAEQADFNKNSIVSFCNNVTQPNLVDLKRFAEILGVSMKELVFDNYSDREMIDFLQFLQNNYQIYQGHYFNQGDVPNNNHINGNHVSHQEILEKFSKYRTV